MAIGKLLNEPGYMAIKANDTVVLSKRIVSYEKIVKGSCTDADMFPINDVETCMAAAFAVGYFDTDIKLNHDNAERPEGCYVFKGELWLATNGGNRGNGAVGERSPLCSSEPYVSTTTTTTSTTTTTTTWGTPSLFCYSVMMTTTYEFGLVKEQIRKGVGILGCDEYAFFSQDGVVELAKTPEGKLVSTIGFEKAPVGWSKDGTAGNSLLFMHVWHAIHLDGRYAKVDWIIKADPDAVVLPERLRTHLKWHTASAANSAWQAPPNGQFLVNCNLHPGNPAFPMIFGSLEAYSSAGLTTYFKGFNRCKNELPWQIYGEDLFMNKCMKLLGVQEFDDFNIVGDKRCGGANCFDGNSAAYHDFKSIPAWFGCWNQAMR